MVTLESGPGAGKWVLPRLAHSPSFRTWPALLVLPSSRSADEETGCRWQFQTFRVPEAAGP